MHAADFAFSTMAATTPAGAASGRPAAAVPRIVLRPAGTPTPAPTATATVPPAPAATLAPAAALAPYSVSAADYAWTVQTLTLDHTLDLAADSRFPTEAAGRTPAPARGTGHTQ